MRPCVKKEASSDHAAVRPGRPSVCNGGLTLLGTASERRSARRSLGAQLAGIAALRKEITRSFVRRVAQRGKISDKTTMFDPPSPCINVYRVDRAKGWCTGCRRTLAEIAHWPTLSPRERRAVIQRVARRK